VQKIIELIDQVMSHPEMPCMGREELEALRACALGGELESTDVEFVIELAEMLGLEPDRTLFTSGIRPFGKENGRN